MPNDEEMTVADNVESFTEDMIDEVHFVLVESKTLSSEVIEALDDGGIIMVRDIARITDIPEDPGIALSDAIMGKLPNEDREIIEDECCDEVAHAVIATLESEHWTDFPTNLAILLLSTIRLTRDQPTLQLKIVERWTTLNARAVRERQQQATEVEELRVREEQGDAEAERVQQQEARTADEMRERRATKRTRIAATARRVRRRGKGGAPASVG